MTVQEVSFYSHGGRWYTHQTPLNTAVDYPARLAKLAEIWIAELGKDNVAFSLIFSHMMFVATKDGRVRLVAAIDDELVGALPRYSLNLGMGDEGREFMRRLQVTAEDAGFDEIEDWLMYLVGL